MKIFHYLFKMTPVYMYIYFGGCDALVTKHLLDSSKIGSIFQQVSGEGMAEGVRTHFFSDSRSFGEPSYNGKDHCAGEFVSSSIQEKRICGFGFNVLMVSNLVLININEFHGVF